MNETILEATPKAVGVTPVATFPTFDEAWSYTLKTFTSVRERGGQVVAAKAWQDRFKKHRPRDIQSKLLGFGKKAVKDCERLAPGGKWTVMAESPTEGTWQFSLWYSKFLPYAHAMMLSENGYKAFGLDFDSINAFFRTCLGFDYIGRGHNPALDEEDSLLYDYCYATSCEVKHVSLPFDEVYRPCLCYIYIRAPKLFDKLIARDDWRREHATQVRDIINSTQAGRKLIVSASLKALS